MVHHCLCCTIHISYTPGQMPVFGRDMILTIKHEANWEYIWKRKQQLTKKNNQSEIAKRTPHTYRVGDQVFIRRGMENKYETRYKGPYQTTKVNENSTMQIKVEIVEDTYIIRRSTPYITLADITHGGECNMQNSWVKGRRIEWQTDTVHDSQITLDSHALFYVLLWQGNSAWLWQ